MRIYIEDCLARSKLPLKVKRTTTIKTIQNLVEEIFKLPENIRIYLFTNEGWKKTESGRTLEYYNIEEDMVLCSTLNPIETERHRRKLQDSNVGLIKQEKSEGNGLIFYKKESKGVEFIKIKEFTNKQILEYTNAGYSSGF